jgi:DNA-binding LytR/AlgR family response regulator
MKAIIIEDEILSAEHLTMLLKKIDVDIAVFQYMDTVKATVNAFKSGLQCDLIFMDIHLADGNAFEIFSQINIETPIIFTTAYDNYAIQAFKKNSVDYLLKPVSFQDLKFSIDKFKSQHESNNNRLYETLARTYKKLNEQYKTRFIVKTGETINTIQTHDILHFESYESYSYLINKQGKRYIIEYSLDQLEKLLPPQDFFRINRKIIIHIQVIEKVISHFNSRLLVIAAKLEGDAQIVSRERVIDFKNWLNS